MTPEEVVATEFDRFRGRMLGMVESWGLPSLLGEDGRVQERGMKSVLKTLSYDSQHRVTELLRDRG